MIDTAYRALDELKAKLTALGFRQLKMTRSWKRRTHREALVEGFLTVDPKMKKADMQAFVLSKLDPLKERFALQYLNERYVHLPYSYVRGDASVRLELMADVALPEEW